MRKILGLFLLIAIVSTTFAQSKRVITGRVLSKSDKSELIGASVYIDKASISQKSKVKNQIESFTLGTTTDIDGNFKIEVPEGVDYLMCSYLGYETTKVKIQDKMVIYLESSSESIGEIIVTGYGNIDKKKYTGAVDKISVAKIQETGVVSVENMLQGKLAGVVSTQATGAPGSPASIRIRGTSSFTGKNSPLWVLDGVALEGNDAPDFSDKDNIDKLYNSSIGGINPQDIENITILKDAAATAIYGARAANGVIVVTTKKGKRGKMKINFNASTSIIAKPNLDKLNLMNSNEKVDLELELAKRADLTHETYRGEISRILDASGELAKYRTDGFSGLSKETQNKINALRGINTNWGDQVYQTAINQDYSLSISGGGDNSNYYFSTGYHKEKGTTIGTGLERYNVSLKTNFDISKKLKVGISTFITKRKNESFLSGQGNFGNPGTYARRANPYTKLKDENGKYFYDRDIKGVSDHILDFNLLEERENTSHELNSLSINSILDINYEIMKGLKFSSQIAYQVEKYDTEKYAAQDSYYNRRMIYLSRTNYNTYKDVYDKSGSRFGWWKHNEADDAFFYIPKGDIYDKYVSDFWQYSIKNLLQFNKEFDGIHSLDLMVGNEVRKNSTETNQNITYGYDNVTLQARTITYPSKQSFNPDFKHNIYENAYVSYFGTASYTYNNKYTLFTSLRYDGSNLFGVDERNKYTPIYSVSGTWRAKEEDFLQNINWLSNLKVRGSYGLQGNVDKNTTSVFVGKYTNVSILPNISDERALFYESLPNRNLRWEKTTSYNAGIDFALFSYAVRASVDFYHRYGTDLISNRNLPLENGQSYANVNWAEMSNKGFEITLSTRNIKTNDFEWNTTINIAKNINKVEKELIRDNSFFPSRKGSSVNSIFALKTAGLDENGYVQFYNKEGDVVSAKEFFKLYDLGAEEYGWPGSIYGTKLTDKERQNLFTNIGSTDPKLSGGIINTFKYKNWDLSISCSFFLGQTVMGNPSYDFLEFDRGYNTNKDVLNAWSETNKTGIYPRLIGKTTAENKYWMEYSNYDAVKLYRTNLDIWAKEMNYLRVNNIRLGYKLPKEILSKANISGAKVSFEARNPFVFANNYDGYFDPETYGNIYAQPIQKSYTVSLNVTF